MLTTLQTDNSSSFAFYLHNQAAHELGSWFPSSIHELACFLFLWTWVVFQPAEEEDIGERELFLFLFLFLSLSLSAMSFLIFWSLLCVGVFPDRVLGILGFVVDWVPGKRKRHTQRMIFFIYKSSLPNCCCCRLREPVIIIIISKDFLPKDLYLLLRILLSVDRASNPVTKSATAHDTQAHTQTKKGVDRFPSTTCQATWSSRRRLPTCRFCVTAIWPP